LIGFVVEIFGTQLQRSSQLCIVSTHRSSIPVLRALIESVATTVLALVIVICWHSAFGGPCFTCNDVLPAQVSLFLITGMLAIGCRHFRLNGLLCLQLTACLTSYIPLLLLPLPLSLSPLHLTLLLLTTYFLNRPCIYCSLLLLILFASSCHWSGRCFVDFETSSDGGYGYAEWFTPRMYTIRSREDSGRNRDNANSAANHQTGVADFLSLTINQTISALAGAALEEARQRLNATSILPSAGGAGGGSLPESAGIGLGWLRSLLGRSEWTIPCVDIKVRL